MIKWPPWYWTVWGAIMLAYVTVLVYYFITTEDLDNSIQSLMPGFWLLMLVYPVLALITLVFPGKQVAEANAAAAIKRSDTGSLLVGVSFIALGIFFAIDRGNWDGHSVWWLILGGSSLLRLLAAKWLRTIRI